MSKSTLRVDWPKCKGRGLCHEVLPDVKPETQILDPWLRLHMYAQRCEDLYARFLEIIAGQNVTWPDGLTFAEAAARLAGNLLALEAVHHEQQIGATARTAGTASPAARR